MTDCEANFPHDCSEKGYSQSMEHNNEWYCKNAYQKFLQAKDYIREQKQKEMQNAIKAVTGGGK